MLIVTYCKYFGNSKMLSYSQHSSSSDKESDLRLVKSSCSSQKSAQAYLYHGSGSFPTGSESAAN